MKIGIVGAGNIGSALARKLSAAGHHIKLANSKDPGSIAELANDIGATAVTKEEAVQDVDIVILSIPFAKYPALADLFADVPESVIIVDTSNYYPFRDGAISEIDGGMPETLWVSEQVGRPVIKAWNAVLAQTLKEGGKRAGEGRRIAIPVAGDDTARKSTVLSLVNETGFDPVDAGDIAMSWRQQPGTPAYCTELAADDLRSALEQADRSRAPEYRETLIAQFIEAGDTLTHDEAVARNRAVTAR